MGFIFEVMISLQLPCQLHAVRRVCMWSRSDWKRNNRLSKLETRVLIVSLRAFRLHLSSIVVTRAASIWMTEQSLKNRSLSTKWVATLPAWASASTGMIRDHV